MELKAIFDYSASFTISPMLCATFTITNVAVEALAHFGSWKEGRTTFTSHQWLAFHSSSTTHPCMPAQLVNKSVAAINPQTGSPLCGLPAELLLHILDYTFFAQFPFSAASWLEEGYDEEVDWRFDEEVDQFDAESEESDVSYVASDDESDESDESDASAGSLDCEEHEVPDSDESVHMDDVSVSSEHQDQIASMDPAVFVGISYCAPAILQSCRLLRWKGRDAFLQYLSEDCESVQRQEECLRAAHHKRNCMRKWQRSFEWPKGTELLRLRAEASERMIDAVEDGEILA
ncbi:hypothetical protein B0A48_09069 [Cryoendolithus antarcticus]|uniref:Uncharacterized protein n=1 Tax=Cryoendolithus antarcticus TaxID=1507870 RepID=A0A1V8T216_9PEZI|nr:hypothetical protein B0A48_09069 [Cryoendolithus antarcticus]